MAPTKFPRVSKALTLYAYVLPGKYWLAEPVEPRSYSEESQQHSSLVVGFNFTLLTTDISTDRISEGSALCCARLQ